GTCARCSSPTTTASPTSAERWRPTRRRPSTGGSGPPTRRRRRCCWRSGRSSASPSTRTEPSRVGSVHSDVVGQVVRGAVAGEPLGVGAFAQGTAGAGRGRDGAADLAVDDRCQRVIDGDKHVELLLDQVVRIEERLEEEQQLLQQARDDLV